MHRPNQHPSSRPPRFLARPLGIALWVAATLLPTSGAALAQAAAAPNHIEYVQVHSGTWANPTAVEGVVWSNFVTVPQGTPWMRLFFSKVFLDQGSYLRMVSLRDGEVMTMHQEHIAQWHSSSAFFNGNAVLVELVAGPHTQGNKVEIDEVLVGDLDPSVVPETICGSTDDRVPATDPRVARVASIGCTGWIIDVPAGPNDRLHLSAGHCFATGQVLQFAVPASASNCALTQPPVAKQFAIDSTTSQQANAGIGSDYWVFKCFANSTTGRTTFQEQGSAFALASSMPAAGATLRITGCGVDGTSTNGGAAANSCGCSGSGGSRNQTIQTDTGGLVATTGTYMQHQVDTCGGNSGSPVIHDVTGVAIGIHTHGGCANPTGSSGNYGTQVTHPGIQAALQSMCGNCAIHVSYGSSCATARSWYELFPANANDLAGQTITAVPNASGGYDVSMAPMSTYNTPNAAGLALTNDSISPAMALPFTFEFPGGSTTNVRIDSNGRVHLAASGATNAAPSVADLIDSTTPLLAAAWGNLNPDGNANTRNVFFTSPGPGEVDITWNDVRFFGVTGAITCQIAIIDNGTADRIEFRYAAVSSPNLTHLVGFSPGIGSVDPGYRDLTAGPFSTFYPELPSLSLSASPAPVLGTVVTYTVGNIRPNASLSQIMGNFVSTAPTPLSIIGVDAPDCVLLIPALGSLAFSPLLLGNPNATYLAPYPSDPAWIGTNLYLQAFELAPTANPGGVISSNGLRSVLSNF